MLKYTSPQSSCTPKAPIGVLPLRRRCVAFRSLRLCTTAETIVSSGGWRASSKVERSHPLVFRSTIAAGPFIVLLSAAAKQSGSRSLMQSLSHASSSGSTGSEHSADAIAETNRCHLQLSTESQRPSPVSIGSQKVSPLQQVEDEVSKWHATLTPLNVSPMSQVEASIELFYGHRKHATSPSTGVPRSITGSSSLESVEEEEEATLPQPHEPAVSSHIPHETAQTRSGVTCSSIGMYDAHGCLSASNIVASLPRCRQNNAETMAVDTSMAMHEELGR